MPYRRRRIRRRTIGKEPRRMSYTFIQNATVGAVKLINAVVPNEVVDQSGSSSSYDVVDTQRTVGPNSIIKYLNFRLQAGIKAATGNAENGYIEYAVVIFDESQAAPTVDALITANIGTQTLGDMCVNLYREKCIWNGAFGISKELPRCQDISLKVPPKFCKCKTGRYIAFLYTFRSSLSTDTTTQLGTVYSHQYKVYL